MEATQAKDSTAWPDREEHSSRQGDNRDRYRPLEGRRRHEAYEQQAAKNWVREHQDIAMLASFALGVFVGIWMRG